MARKFGKFRTQFIKKHRPKTPKRALTANGPFPCVLPPPCSTDHRERPRSVRKRCFHTSRTNLWREPWRERFCDGAPLALAISETPRQTLSPAYLQTGRTVAKSRERAPQIQTVRPLCNFGRLQMGRTVCKWGAPFANGAHRFKRGAPFVNGRPVRKRGGRPSHLAAVSQSFDPRLQTRPFANGARTV